MNGDGVSWGSSLKPLMRSMEANQAPRHKRSFSDVPDLKLGEDVKECIFAAPPLRRKPGMGHDKCSPGSWEKPACGPEVGAQDQQKPAEDLIKEIATLEMQVAQLEQHLLSLYRKKFDQQVEPNSARFLPEEVWRGVRERRRDDKLDYSGRFADPRMVGKSKEFQSARFMSEQRGRGGIWAAGDDKMNYSSRHADHRISSIVKDLEMEFNSARFFPELRGGGAKTEKDEKVDLSNLEEPVKKGAEKWGEQKILDSSINRTNSSLSQHLAAKYSTIQRIVAEAAQSEHSLPLSMFEAQDATLGASFNAADSRRIETVPETPNWLSEEMVRCISAVYCKLADPPLSNQDRWASPFSFSSAAGEFSPEDHSLGSHLENSFFTEKSRFSGTHCTMIEVKQIRQDGEKLKEADQTLLRFRALVLRLDKADPRKLKHRQKLAFWINVHNALVMHAFLVYGIPQNSLKRMSLVLKAAYNVGGQTVNVEMIQRSLLGCRLPRPGQWLQSLLFPRTKFKASDPRRLFAIDHVEPLLHFALCSGSHSDPAVRVYTPMRVYQELEAAKDDYIQLELRIIKEQKILLPKTVELFAKDCDLNPAGFAELLEPFLPTSLRKSIKQKHRVKLWRSIRWIPHDFAFRYLFSRELAP